MKRNPMASATLVAGFAMLCGCQTDADRERDTKRLQELGAVSADKFCTDPTFSEAKKIANRGNGLAGVFVARTRERSCKCWTV
jgi:hypothetical protein